MTPLEKEITELSEKWYKYVNMDHHKDRDCHWYVEQKWSYGQEPYFQAYHDSYVGGDFQGTKCTTIEEAQEELRDNLLLQIHNAKEWLNREIAWWQENKDKVDDEDSIFWGDPDTYKEILKLLEEK